MARKRSASVHPAVDGPRAMRPLYAAGGLVRLVPLFAGTLLALALWGAPAAQAAGCTGDTWTNTAGGSWTTGANWSKKAPPTVSEAACITEPGTYTVTISQASATAETLTLGASSGKQTLIVELTAGGNSELHTASGMTVGVNGALTLTQGGIVASADILSGGAIVNEGTLSTLAGAAGGERRLETSITNTGTVAVDTTTLFQNGSTTFTNEGALNLAEAALLKIGSATLTDGTGGSMNTAAGASVVLGGSATYNQGNGTTSGALPVLAEASNLNFTGGGAATIHERGYYAHLSGNIAHGQTLAIEGCGWWQSRDRLGREIVRKCRHDCPHEREGQRVRLRWRRPLTSSNSNRARHWQYRHDHDRSGHWRRTPARRPGDQQGHAQHRRGHRL